MGRPFLHCVSNYNTKGRFTISAVLYIYISIYIVYSVHSHTNNLHHCYGDQIFSPFSHWILASSKKEKKIGWLNFYTDVTKLIHNINRKSLPPHPMRPFFAFPITVESHNARTGKLRFRSISQYPVVDTESDHILQ